MKFIRTVIRFSLFFVISIGLYVVWFMGNLIVPNKQYWRQVFFSLWAKWFVMLAGMTVEVIGERPAPPFFLVSNHLSYVDIPVLRSEITSLFVAKGDIREWTLAGRIVSDMGNVFVNRDNRRDIPRAGSEIISKLENGEGIIIFPEGTSTKGEEVLPFNSSFFEFAARIRLPVHYASITYRVESGELAASDAVCWWDDTSFVAHLWRFFQVRRSKAIVSFGVEPVAGEDRKILARDLWKRVSKKFVPVI